jgi:3-phosphoshikimate 1-carboxyvinyltransferase
MDATVPGDISSAAFFIAAALAISGSRLRIQNVGLNSTRTAFITLLREMGAQIFTEDLQGEDSEPFGDVIVAASELTGGDIGGSWIPAIIDEIPVLAVLSTQTRQGIRIHDAVELRTKETDRIRALVENLRNLKIEAEEYPDGLFVPGNQQVRGGSVDSFGDHRIAMAFAVAALFASDPVTIRNAGCVGVSFPDFFQTLNSVSDV